MSASTLITDYIGYGTAASRPATPLAPTGCLAFWFATDTLRLSVWDGSWQDIIGPATTDTLTNKTISGGTVNNAPIGGTTASSGKFTTLSASGAVSGAGFSSYLASPPTIGGATPNVGIFASLSTTGVSSQIAVGDRSVNGNTSLFYRSADVGRFWDNNAGDVLFYDSSGRVSIGVAPSGAGVRLEVDGPIRAGTYTVATLPAGLDGMRAYVTDATAPTFLAALVGGGTAHTPVFYNGAAWVAG